MFSPSRYGVGSTMLGIRGGADMSLRKLPAPRTKLRPPVSIAALSACGLVNGKLDGANASTRFSVMNPIRCAECPVQLRILDAGSAAVLAAR